jgi:hypothetical protein
VFSNLKYLELPVVLVEQMDQAVFVPMAETLATCLLR